jgi:prepilin-type N-terminal cleavage/methylation domain-containing protein
VTRQRGFTLIEVILATSLFALLMSSYYVVFTRVVELEEYARDQRAFGSVGPAVLDQIEDDLLSLYTHARAPDAFPFRGQDETLGGKPADRMFFVARRASIHQEEFFGADNWTRSPINEVGYRLSAGPRALGNVRVIYRRENYYVDDSPLDGGDYFEIYDRVVEFDVWYAGYPVEETERSDQDTLGEHRLEKFESWDSEERRAFPTAVIVKLVIQPPRMTRRQRSDDEDIETRTYLRIIPMVHAEDVKPDEGGPGETSTSETQDPTGTGDQGNQGNQR